MPQSCIGGYEREGLKPLRVLIVGFDATIVAVGRKHVPGDTLLRHVRYAKALRDRFPNGSLTVLVRVPLGWSGQPKYMDHGLTVLPVPCPRPLFLPRAWPVARRLFSRQSFDVVSTQTPFDDGLLGVLLKCQHGVALNVQMRGSFIDMPYWIQQRPVVYRLFNALGKWVASRADTIRVVSYGERARLTKAFPAWRAKIAVLHPLVNRQMFERPVSPDELDRVRQTLVKHGFSDRPYILFVGRLGPEKNVSTLLHAHALLQAERVHVPLVICGDGPLRPKLVTIVRRLGLENAVLWLGSLPLEALRAWYTAARVVVSPSFCEGFGKVIVEAYLLRTPVVVTPFVSAPELVVHGHTGFVTRHFTDARELAGYIGKLLADEALARAMGARGYDHVHRYLLDDEQYLSRLVELWEWTANSARGG